MKYVFAQIVLSFFFIPIAYAFPDSISMLDVMQEKLNNTQKIVAQAPDFSEKGETFTALNNIRKEFLQPAEGMRDAARFLEKTQELNAFNQGTTIQKMLQEKKSAYAKEKRKSKGLEASLDKTPSNDSALPSKKKKLETIHEGLARMEEEIKILEDARAGNIQSVIARAKTESAQLALIGGDKLDALE